MNSISMILFLIFTIVLEQTYISCRLKRRSQHYIVGSHKEHPYFVNTPELVMEERFFQKYDEKNETAFCPDTVEKCHCYWIISTAGIRCDPIDTTLRNRRKKSSLNHHAYDLRWEILRPPHPNTLIVQSTHLYKKTVHCKKFHHDKTTTRWYCLPFKKGASKNLNKLYNVRTPLKRLYLATHAKRDPGYQRWSQEADDLTSMLPL